MRKIFKFNSAGFTLVELLVSITVFVVVGVIAAGIITSSLRGTNKVTTVESIRQSGNYALSQISKDMQYAETFNGFSNDGSTYVTNCPFSVSPTPAPVQTQYNFIKVTPFGANSPIVYNCTSLPPVLTANAVSLVDANSVSLMTCSLICTRTKAADVPVVKINFTIGPKNPNNSVENSTPPILFETSISIRNYIR